MARPRTFQSPLLTLAALVLVVAALHLAKEILVPVALAVFFSFLLTPLANRLERWKFPRVVSVISVVAVTFVVVGVLGWIVTSQLVDLGANLPQWRDSLVAKAKSIKPSSSTIEDINQTIKEVNKAIAEPEKSDRGAKTKESKDKTPTTAAEKNEAVAKPGSDEITRPAQPRKEDLPFS